MLGAPTADSMTYSNVEQESIEFVRYSLTPWLRRIELAISHDGDLASGQFSWGRSRPKITKAAHWTASLNPLEKSAPTHQIGGMR